jgi:predicted homoserine dehydrogenase-like protein
MIIVDTELRKRAAAGRPVRVGMAGAGFMGRGIVNQLAHYLPGMRLVAIYCRNPQQGLDACAGNGLPGAQAVENLANRTRSMCSSTPPATSSSARNSPARRSPTKRIWC